MANSYKIKAPAKTIWRLVYKNRCQSCGKVISMDKTLCSKCDAKFKRAIKI